MAREGNFLKATCGDGASRRRVNSPIKLDWQAGDDDDATFDKFQQRLIGSIDDDAGMYFAAKEE